MTTSMGAAFSLKDVEAFAKRQANRTGEAFGIWEHVGRYGDPTGDVEARHVFSARNLNRPDPPTEWALVGTVDPDGV